uniref:Uncharacterized protein LOC113791364 n=1 Tax=Dermatophagoides pteronyssinus TaxID=6956 RepID=A0A6P6XVF2_DERPT|nr:uncharacterized protein LOC113791364 [Dermatophagoides pteronyssinus]
MKIEKFHFVNISFFAFQPNQTNLSNMNPFKQSNENIKIRYFFRQGFQSLKFFNLRINYNLNDYEQRNISWSFSTIKQSILITMNGWITILYLLCWIIWSKNDYLISIDIYNKILHLNNGNFIVIELIIVFILREYLYYKHLLQFINYKSKINDFLIKYWHYDDNELLSEFRNHLIQFYQKSRLIAIISYRIFTIGLLGIIFIFGYFSYHLYECDQINLIKFLMSTIFFFLTICQCIYIIGDSFIMIKKLFWNQFHQEYVNLYSEIDQFNLTLCSILLFTELVSKSSAVICLLFYSHQIKMHMQNTLITLIFITIFISINILNFRIANLPSYNRICWLSIHRWIARSQWLNLKRKKPKNNLPLRYSFKSRLFLQSMTNNLFGFTCGR